MKKFAVYWLHITEYKSYKKGYIGVSSNPKIRWDHQHKPSLKKGLHYNIRLQKAFNKYGVKIKLKIIFKGSRVECLAKEQSLRPRVNMGWNIAAGGGYPPGGKPWNKDRIQARKIYLANNPNHFVTNNPMKNPEIIAKHNGLFKKGYISPWIGSKEHIKHNRKMMCENNPMHNNESIKNFVSSRKNNGQPWHSEETKINMSIAHQGKILTTKHKKAIGLALGRKVSINGIVYNSVSEASRKLGINNCTLHFRVHSKHNKNCFYL